MLEAVRQQQFPIFQPAPPPRPVARRAASAADFAQELREFQNFGTRSIETVTRAPSADGRELAAPTFINEFWTARQRQMHSLHEVSYRACFKPRLPCFFIERLTRPGSVVYDPFMGRGTTLLEAALLDRTAAGNDINPLSAMFLRPRVNPPAEAEVHRRLQEIPFHTDSPIPEELLVFYHPETLQEIVALKEYLLAREAAGTLDSIDDWIRMVAVNRLTGHSTGFFSVYTLPPNQAVSIKSQFKINERRQQVPPRRDVRKIIEKKSRNLLGGLDEATRRRLRARSLDLLLLNAPAAETAALPSESVSLVVTSPPFLDVVDYAGDNWLRCWFTGIDAKSVAITTPRKLGPWEAEMTRVFTELHRVLRPGGHVAFEVGEIKNGKIKLEESVLRCGAAGGLVPELVLINQQEFTKTANCWGVDNNSKGTNSNRIVLFRKS